MTGTTVPAKIHASKIVHGGSVVGAWLRVRIPLRSFGNFGNFLYSTLPVSFGRDAKSR